MFKYILALAALCAISCHASGGGFDVKRPIEKDKKTTDSNQQEPKNDDDQSNKKPSENQEVKK